MQRSWYFTILTRPLWHSYIHKATSILLHTIVRCTVFRSIPFHRIRLFVLLLILLFHSKKYSINRLLLYQSYLIVASIHPYIHPSTHSLFVVAIVYNPLFYHILVEHRILFRWLCTSFLPLFDHSFHVAVLELVEKVVAVFFRFQRFSRQKLFLVVIGNATTPGSFVFAAFAVHVDWLFVFLVAAAVGGGCIRIHLVGEDFLFG